MQKYTIFEDMGFHSFRLNTPPGIRNVFHVDKLRAVSADFFPPQVSNDNHPGPSIINNENSTHEYRDFEEKEKMSRLPMSGEMERFAREPAPIMENTVALDEFEANLN